MSFTQDKFFILAVVVLFSTLIYFLAPVLTPFLIAFFLAYLMNPLVNKLMKLRLSRGFSVWLVFSVVFAILTVGIMLFIPFIEDQINLFIEQIPTIITWIHDSLDPLIAHYLNINLDAIDVPAMKKLVVDNWSKADGLVNWFFKYIFKSGFKLFELLMNLLLIPVVTIYLLFDWNKLINSLHNFIPRRIEPTIVKLVRESDSVLSAFLRGQLLVMLALGLIYGLGLSLVGLQMGLLIGLVAGLLGIVPYLGTIVGIAVGIIMAMIQFGSLSSVLLVSAVFLFGQTLDHIFLTPKLVGDRIGLHPVAVIFSVLAGGSLFGFIGVLLALPVAAVLLVWLRYLNSQYRDSALYKTR